MSNDLNLVVLKETNIFTVTLKMKAFLSPKTYISIVDFSPISLNMDAFKVMLLLSYVTAFDNKPNLAHDFKSPRLDTDIINFFSIFHQISSIKIALPSFFIGPNTPQN